MFIDRTRRNVRRPAIWLCCLSLGGCGSTSEPKPTADKQMETAHDTAPNPSKPAEKTEEDDPGMMPVPSDAKAPAIAVAANDAHTRGPTDATPSPDGARVYYTAFSTDDSGETHAGVFAAAADGGGKAAIETLASGVPLLAPVGITTSLDGKQLFVADSASGDDASGGLFGLAADGGAIALLSGSAGYRPAGVIIAKVDQEELLYFTGRDPQSGDAGLFSIAPSGGAPRSVAVGEPFNQPGGVVLAAKGDAYVVDVAEHSARVVRVHEGKAEVFVDNIGVGFPAGITLTHDDSTLLVSGLDPTTKHDLVYFVDVASSKVTQLTQAVGAFSESAGLHRAHDTDVFAWADSEANESGTVYVLKP